MSETKTYTATELKDLAEQIEVEISILLGIEQSIRRALQWMTRDRGNTHKLETLRFAARSFERHLTRTRALADDGGYMHAITDANPHLAGEVKALKGEREALQVNFERIILQLEDVSPNDAAAFSGVCIELDHFLDDLDTHGQREMSLLQHSFVQEEGGSG